MELLLLHLLAWLRPATDVDVVPDYMPASKVVGQAEELLTNGLQHTSDAAVQKRVSTQAACGGTEGHKGIVGVPAPSDQKLRHRQNCSMRHRHRP
jgi:hypothetical protein